MSVVGTVAHEIQRQAVAKLQEQFAEGSAVPAAPYGSGSVIELEDLDGDDEGQPELRQRRGI